MTVNLSGKLRSIAAEATCASATSRGVELV